MSWKILDMQHKASDGFVIEVSSCYESKNGLGYARKVFTQEFEGEVGPDFIPYEDLTEEIVLGWVKQELGAQTVSETESLVVAKAIENKQELEAPAVKSGKPWTENTQDLTADL